MRSSGRRVALRRIESLEQSQPFLKEEIPSSIVIQNLSPLLDGGRFPIKCLAGETFTVEADIFKHGHDRIEAQLWYQRKHAEKWESAPMIPLENDRWRGGFVPRENNGYLYAIEAWKTTFADSPKKGVTRCAPLELFADRKRAEFGAWYELFPRSQGCEKNKSGTFKDCLQRLPDIKRMGFHVIYLPPIHPIGHTNRKGPNNSQICRPGDPGSPWAIGDAHGGHKAIHPDLGTMEDFQDFVDCAADFGIEIALDLAFQCSPDHPYVKEHPEWFYHLPDGSIRYAENPPKKYEDIYPLDLECEDKEALWEELKSIVLFWIRKGIKIFRVDNPHTKPLPFWPWLIGKIQERHPEVIFVAEAFTRPSIMKYLAKAGFTQSYTYFTWRNQKWEIRQYLEELTQSEMKYYFRGNLFVNTPDILTEILQKGGRPAFEMRLVLAATLSASYGIYSGYELCENQALRPGSEEYLDSEKYQYKPREWDQPGNIKDLITLINQIRIQNPALQRNKNLEFFESHNDAVLAYGKRTEDHSNIIVTVVNLDPFQVQEDWIHIPIWKFGIEEWQTYQMKDLLTGEKYYWKGSWNYVRLDPNVQPAHVFLLRK